jgi:hypothetical protein
MPLTYPNSAPARLDIGESPEIVERYRQSPRIESRTEFLGWLESAISDVAETPPDEASGSSLSGLYPRIWEIAAEAAARVCPDGRNELGETAPGIASSTASREDLCQLRDQLLERLRAALALIADPEESDADRLAKYLLNFSSRGHKAMITELWTKGRVSNQRLANLRGKYSVTSHADRNAIYRLLTKAESLWSKERQVRIRKDGSGLILEKHA